jgi:hypothetical protein
VPGLACNFAFSNLLRTFSRSAYAIASAPCRYFRPRRQARQKRERANAQLNVCFEGIKRTSSNHHLPISIYEYAPFCNGPDESSPPSDRHAAELALLSVVDAKAATLCC